MNGSCTRLLSRCGASALALAILLVGVSPLHAALGTPSSIGASSSAAGGSTVVITTSAAVSTGNVILVSFTMGSMSSGTVTCVDFAGNTYANDVDVTGSVA